GPVERHEEADVVPGAGEGARQSDDGVGETAALRERCDLGGDLRNAESGHGGAPIVAGGLRRPEQRPGALGASTPRCAAAGRWDGLRLVAGRIRTDRDRSRTE